MDGSGGIIRYCYWCAKINGYMTAQTEGFVDAVRNMRIVEDDVETKRLGSQCHRSANEICPRRTNGPTVCSDIRHSAYVNYYR